MRMSDAGHLIAPSQRPVHDQIIQHDLVGVDKGTALLIIEMRRLREQIAGLAEKARGPYPGPPPALKTEDGY